MVIPNSVTLELATSILLLGLWPTPGVYYHAAPIVVSAMQTGNSPFSAGRPILFTGHNAPHAREAFHPWSLTGVSPPVLGTSLFLSITSTHVKRFLPRPCCLLSAKSLINSGIIFTPASHASLIAIKGFELTVLSPAYTLTAMFQNFYFPMFAIVLRPIKAWHVNMWPEKSVT